MCSFLWLSNIPLYICTTLPYTFICGWTSRLFPYPCTLVKMCIFQLWTPQDICPVVGLLGHRVVLFLAFKGCHTVLHSSCINLPHQQCKRLPFSPHPLLHYILCRLFDDGHSDQCELILHCNFDFNFSKNEQCRASFHVFISHL